MSAGASQISLEQWDARHRTLCAQGLRESWYGGPLSRHVADGDYRLLHLRFDNSPAALRLWNFLLTEEMRLNRWRSEGRKIVGTMKDLGTIPVMAYALPNVVAFYPDGAWWVPCIMEQTTRDYAAANSMGIDESFCPVRAMLGAFLNCEHFPAPDLLICSVGATCDDFSSIAQRLEATGREILWWEIPPRRKPEACEPAITLPGGFVAPVSQVAIVESELERIRQAMSRMAGEPLTDAMLAASIETANQARALLAELRHLVFTAQTSPLPALEMLITEMLAIHYCSDRDEALAIYAELIAEVKRRIAGGVGVLPPDAARVFWVNPVADLQAMNLLEESGGRLCGTEFLFCHALDAIPTGCPPIQALAQAALADPMVGPCSDRAARICRDAKAFGAEALVLSRIPGASHCAWEGQTVLQQVQQTLGIPAIEIEVPPVDDAVRESLRTRLEALVETVKVRRR